MCEIFIKWGATKKSYHLVFNQNMTKNNTYTQKIAHYQFIALDVKI